MANGKSLSHIFDCALIVGQVRILCFFFFFHSLQRSWYGRYLFRQLDNVNYNLCWDALIYKIGHLILESGNQASPESVNHLHTDRRIWASVQQQQDIPPGTREDGR